MNSYECFIKSAGFYGLMLLCFTLAGCSAVVYDSVFTINNADFGIHADKTDARATTDGINRAIDKAREGGFKFVKFTPGDYLVAGVGPIPYYPTDGIFLYSNMTFDLGEARFYVEPNDNRAYGVFQLERLENVTVTGGEVIGDKDEHIYPEDPDKRLDHQYGNAFDIISCENILIKDVKMRSFTGNGVRVYPYSYMLMYKMYPTDNLRITGCRFTDIGITGIYLKHAVNVEIDNNSIANISNLIGHTNPWKVCGIKTEKNGDDNLSLNMNIHDNHITGAGGGIVVTSTFNVEIYDNTVEETQMGIGLIDCHRVRVHRNTVAEPGYADVTHAFDDEYNEDICIPLEGPNKNNLKMMRPYTALESGDFSCE
jgi:hypothetical protein